MAGAATYDRIRADVLALLARIPLGRLATHGAIGRHLRVDPRHIVNVMIGLDAAERSVLPWWRVVADGGAIGRHALRDEQIARLKSEGVPVAPVGIAQELGERALRHFDEPAAGTKSRATPTPQTASSRSRGMKSHPTSTLQRPGQSTRRVADMKHDKPTE